MAVDKPKTATRKTNVELLIMNRLDKMLSALDAETKARVMGWIVPRHAPELVEKKACNVPPM